MSLSEYMKKRKIVEEETKIYFYFIHSFCYSLFLRQKCEWLLWYFLFIFFFLPLFFIIFIPSQDSRRWSVACTTSQHRSILTWPSRACTCLTGIRAQGITMYNLWDSRGGKIMGIERTRVVDMIIKIRTIHCILKIIL